jgi:Dolichyl-phosphate-mannose-protein mannosyltransferase
MPKCNLPAITNAPLRQSFFPSRNRASSMTANQPRFKISAQIERWLAALFIALLLVAKIVYSFAYRADSDETQHLHVVWGWANGLLPYRDLFDNHSPLFQFLCSPLLRLLGERADIVIPMRWAVIPLYFLCLWCVYRCGTILFSRRLAVWAAIFTGAYPIFFTKSTEFRTDDLWAPLWMLAIVALIRRPMTWMNAFWAGLALGATFATSMKTSALVICLGVALLLVLISKAVRKAPFEWKRLPGLLIALLAGMAIVPALVVAYFASRGALPNLYYCVIQHNLVAGFVRLDIAKRAEVFLLPILLSLIGGYFTVTRATDPGRRDRLAVIALTSAALALMLGLYWPIIEPHDILPLAPLMFLAAIPALARAFESDASAPGPGLLSVGFPLIACVEIGALLLLTPPRFDGLNETTTLISDILGLTTKQDYVMDAKGDSVFRRRAIYYVLEGVTLHRFEVGLLQDDIPEQLIATRAPVASILRTPARARQFIEQNYIPVAYRLRVLGQMLVTNGAEPAGTRAFEIVIPADYMLVSEHGSLVATLDGKPVEGARYLERGRHEVRISSGSGRIALVLAKAIEKGFSPFSANARDVVKDIVH